MNPHAESMAAMEVERLPSEAWWTGYNHPLREWIASLKAAAAPAMRGVIAETEEDGPVQAVQRLLRLLVLPASGAVAMPRREIPDKLFTGLAPPRGSCFRRRGPRAATSYVSLRFLSSSTSTRSFPRSVADLSLIRCSSEMNGSKFPPNSNSTRLEKHSSNVTPEMPVMT
jgi:hypothetical protein